jgi:hypothetical protein
MGFKVVTDATNMTWIDFPDDARWEVLEGGVLQVTDAAGARTLFSPYGGWTKVEDEPGQGGRVW